MCVFVVFTSQEPVFQLYMLRHRCTGGLKKKFNNCLGEKILYSQLSGGIDNYRASYPLKYYHTTNCLGERLLYSQFKGEILLYSSLSLILHRLFFIKTIRQYPYKKWKKMVVFIFNGRHFYNVAYYLPSQHRLNLSNTTRKDPYKNARNLQWGTFLLYSSLSPILHMLLFLRWYHTINPPKS